MIYHTISKFHHWALRKIVRANIMQGPNHHHNLAEIFRVIVTECRKEFSEDNVPTQYYFLSDGFDRGFYEAEQPRNNLTVDQLQEYRENFTEMVHRGETDYNPYNL